MAVGAAAAKAVELPARTIMAAAATGANIRKKRRIKDLHACGLPVLGIDGSPDPRVWRRLPARTMGGRRPVARRSPMREMDELQGPPRPTARGRRAPAGSGRDDGDDDLLEAGADLRADDAGGVDLPDRLIAIE